VPSVDTGGEVPVTPPPPPVGGKMAGDALPDDASPVIVAVPALKAEGAGGAGDGDTLSLTVDGDSPSNGTSVATPGAETEVGAAALAAADLTMAAGAAAGVAGTGRDLPVDGGDGEVICSFVPSPVALVERRGPVFFCSGPVALVVS